MELTGIPFRINFLAATNHPTGDGRVFRALDLAPFPQPFRAQFEDRVGHEGAVSTGRLTEIVANEDGTFSALGMYDLHPDSLRAARLAAAGSMPGVSVEVDQFEGEMLEDGTIDIGHGRIRGATQVALPAFVEAQIEVDMADVEAAELAMATASNGATPQAITISLAASAVPDAPPVEWFETPEFAGPTPLTITDDGRVFGHLALFDSCHIGFDTCVSPPHSNHEYAYFNTGEVVCADGTRVSCGVLTMGAGHATKSLGARAAAEHYDNTAATIADVRAGEDQWGPWLAGAVRPDATEGDIRALRASAPSGDWRRIGGNLELIAALAVNVPGFPVPRPSMLVADGQCQTLVAAGGPVGVRDPLDARLDALEVAVFGPARADADLREIEADAVLASIESTRLG